MSSRFIKMPWKIRKKLRASKKFLLRKTVRRTRAQSRIFQLSNTVAVLGEVASGKTTICRKLTSKMYPDGFERATEYYNVDISLNSKEISLAQNADMKRHWIPLLVDFEERHDILRRRDPTIVVT
uniref:Uncharacterized protein n=1 Tax=Clytia hemisphaerica TaxID=252671 RepID=A0A7M5UJQ5_9CNID